MDRDYRIASRVLPSSLGLFLLAQVGAIASWLVDSRLWFSICLIALASTLAPFIIVSFVRARFSLRDAAGLLTLSGLTLSIFQLSTGSALGREGLAIAAPMMVGLFVCGAGYGLAALSGPREALLRARMAASTLGALVVVGFSIASIGVMALSAALLSSSKPLWLLLAALGAILTGAALMYAANRVIRRMDATSETSHVTVTNVQPWAFD